VDLKHDLDCLFPVQAENRLLKSGDEYRRRLVIVEQDNGRLRHAKVPASLSRGFLPGMELSSTSSVFAPQNMILAFPRCFRFDPAV
jgi:hypothetical protein